MSAVESTASSNKDLEWGLESINQRQLAIEFATQFESRLCVYSASVEQFYTNYTINFAGSDASKMVILPNPYAFHDTFHGIAPSAIRDTGLYIVPGELMGKKGLYLRVTLRDKTAASPAPIPFKQAIKKMLASQDGGDPFLPVLVKGDLREFDAKMPCLHLHRIKLPAIERLSEFEKKSIKSAITDKLVSLYEDSAQFKLGKA